MKHGRIPSQTSCTLAELSAERDEVRLYFNGLAPVPGGLLIGRIEALEEIAVPLVSPSLEGGGQQLVCPVSLNPAE